jgi:hypothetical protein
VITDDEVMRLFERADPARVDDAAPVIDAAGYLYTLRERSSNVTLIDTEPTPIRPPSRHRWPIIIAAAAAVVLLVVGAVIVAARDNATVPEIPAGPPPTLAPATPAIEAKVAAPESITACVNAGPEVTHGTDERIEVSLPDGTMVVERRRGYTWRQVLGDVSDPRLDGAWYQSWDGDAYTLPGGEPGPLISAVTLRAENDEGAWQGSSVSIELPDGTATSAPLVMTGEGAYQGLTAVLAGEGCFQGYIIEVPAPPLPNTAEDGG